MENPAQATETQGSPSKIRVEMTVLRADNLPNKKRLRIKRRFFVTVSHEATTKKSRSVKIRGQVAEWNQKLDAFVVQPSSRLVVRLYAKRRFLYRDILVGTQEIPPPDRSTDLSFDLKGNNTQANEAKWPVMIHLRVNVSVNATSPNFTASPIPADATFTRGFPTPILPTDRTNPTTARVNRFPSERVPQSPMVHTPKSGPSMEPPPPRMDRLPTRTSNTLMSPPADARVKTSPTRNTLYNRDESTTTVKVDRQTDQLMRARLSGPLPSLAHENTNSNEAATTVRASVEAPDSGPELLIPEYENTIDDIIQTVDRFRILSIGRSGVGKSSLINSVFGINAAQVADYKPGEADIQQEFVSPQNQYFVLHDSQGFEPGDLSNFETVRDFVQQRSHHALPLNERIHGLWLCTETPTAGGRVFETGDEKLLTFAHRNQVPIVIVFTQYDRLVRTKEAELREDHPHMDRARVHEQGVAEAKKAFTVCLQSLQRTADRLRIPMPRHAKVSVRPGHQEDVSDLVKVTRDIVKERVKGDAWVLWAIAQRASLPVKIDACVTKGLSHYRRALAGCTPGMGELLLRRCLGNVHKDIITCWNFKGEVLNSPEFRQLMLCLVQDVYIKPGAASPPAIDVINNFVTLATSAAAPIAPPVAILGLTYVFVQWLSTTVLENAASVHRLLIAYTVDLIRVLRELFDLTLRPELALATTWTEVQEAFEAYERSHFRQRVHTSICSRTAQDEQVLTPESISMQVRELLRD